MNSKRKVSVLVADDDLITLELAQRTLEQAGYHTLITASGEQAIEIATSQEIDLALLDYRMPGLSGLAIGQAIMHLTAARFIIMSVNADEAVIKQAGGDGALGFLAKPFEANELLAQVNVGLTRAEEIKTLQSSLKDIEQLHAAALSKAVTSARSVNTAIGILMERLSQTRDEATQLITRAAKHRRVRMIELAEHLINEREEDYRSRNKDRWWLGETDADGPRGKGS